jgi:hypothetical protein
MERENIEDRLLPFCCSNYTNMIATLYFLFLIQIFSLLEKKIFIFELAHYPSKVCWVNFFNGKQSQSPNNMSSNFVRFFHKSLWYIKFKIPIFYLKNLQPVWLYMCRCITLKDETFHHFDGHIFTTLWWYFDSCDLNLNPSCE